MAFTLSELNSLGIMGGKWKNHSISVITDYYCPLVLMMLCTVLLCANLGNCKRTEPLRNMYKYFSSKAEKKYMLNISEN